MINFIITTKFWIVSIGFFAIALFLYFYTFPNKEITKDSFLGEQIITGTAVVHTWTGWASIIIGIIIAVAFVIQRKFDR